MCSLRCSAALWDTGDNRDVIPQDWGGTLVFINSSGRKGIKYIWYLPFTGSRSLLYLLDKTKGGFSDWGEAGLEPAELGTGPPRPADGHRRPCSALSQSRCGWVMADLHLARPEGNTTHLPYGNLSGIFQFCIRALNGPCECPFCKAEERLDAYHLKSQSFLKWALAFLSSHN